ncbi:hypothetical protein GCM10010300_80320 [Streptomyces olivaceoviridis]|nr:hypothetical protein GCM10010300_80320 [Streptomyces olivaceoviridis]
MRRALGLYFFVTGLGAGAIPMVALTVVRNSVPAARLGAAGAVVTFARSIGAAFGVAVFGVLLVSACAVRVQGLPCAGGFGPFRRDAVGRLAGRAHGAAHGNAHGVFAHATATGFLRLVPALVIGVVPALSLRRGPGVRSFSLRGGAGSRGRGPGGRLLGLPVRRRFAPRRGGRVPRPGCPS